MPRAFDHLPDEPPITQGDIVVRIVLQSLMRGQREEEPTGTALETTSKPKTDSPDDESKT